MIQQQSAPRLVDARVAEVVQSVVATMIQQQLSDCGARGVAVAIVLQSVVATMIQQQPSDLRAVAAAVLQSVVARITQQQASDLCPAGAATVVQSVVATIIQQQLAEGGCGARMCKGLPPLRYDPPLDISLSRFV
jgi:hypothetical protein